ncbi:FkbM family methyltransferase [Nocardioides caeni]|uniref:FkbM family methyltransferase n=1 Tax=Nocardioides caeni TaxID=574700 RepID=A0A4S8N183_9ACTN|nr:FkbM family methyltransferase [Nocardioides caeni]THV09201.1 FkbM family methyltransferase [Nocardioides caeni]
MARPPARPIALTARRLRQTVTSFENGTTLLAGLARRSDELVFETGELTITCPNIAGARVPVYEVFAENAYRLDWFTQDLPTVRALDIGGHIGCFTTALSVQRPDARIWTYEASPATAAFTRRNIDGNGLQDRVTLNNEGVTSYDGTLSFADNAGGSGLNGLTAPEGTKVIEIPCVSLATAMERAGGDITLVKIDTEGAEYDIVLPSDPAAWASVQRVVLEYHPVDGHSWAELKEFFASAGLQVVLDEPVTDRLGTAWLSRTPLPDPA